MELSLGLAFISALLVMVSIISIHISTTYHKGLVIRAVNSTGRLLVDDFSRTIAAAPARALADICRAEYAVDKVEMQKCLSDNARMYVYQQNYGTVCKTSQPTAYSVLAVIAIYGILAMF